MADDFKPGLEGVVAFETEIAEPDKDGGALRYRGVDIEDLIGQVSFGNVWALLVDGKFGPACRRPSRSRCRCTPATSGSTCSPRWPCWPRTGAQAAARHRRRAGPRGPGPGLGHRAVLRRPVRARPRPARGAAEGDRQGPDDRRAVHGPLARRARPAHVKAVDAYFISAAEHGMNASTFTARVVASTGADAAACISGHRRPVRPAARRRPLAGAAHDRRVEASGDAEVRQGRARPRRAADGLRPPGLPGRGPRAPACCAAPPRSWAPRFEVAEALEKAALAELRARRPTGRSRPTSSSGRRWCSTSPRCRRTCSPRCSPVPGWPAGARTSWSRRRPAAWSGRRPATSAPARASPRRSRAGTPSRTKATTPVALSITQSPALTPTARVRLSGPGPSGRVALTDHRPNREALPG